MPNPENLRPKPYDSERGRENQKKSVASRKRNKTIAETTKMVLDTKVTDPKQLATIEKAGLPVPDKPTYRDFLVAGIMVRMIQKGRTADLTELMRILGEEPQSADTGQTKALQGLMDAIKGDGDAD